MNNYDNFFDNLFPLRPLLPFVQSVLPTVFDDSLSYLETLGKVVKALNDTESNVNTLEQAVRAFADELALYGNLTISLVEITFNQETGRFSASMEYADIVSAIEEGHTMVVHVVDDLHDTEYYTATMKVTETGGGVKVLYWESPAFTVNGVTVFYEPFINENDTVGVTTRTITGSGGGVDTFIIHYDSETETGDKPFSEIVAAIEAEKTVVLIADHFFVSNAHWTTSGNDELGYEVISVQFTAFDVVTAPSGKNLGCVTYAVDDNDTWTVTRNGFPNESRVNALIDVKLAQLEGFNSIIKLDYNESTGAVTYWDGEQTVNASGQYISNNLIDSSLPQMIILEGIEQHGVGMTTVNTYLPVEYGQTTGAWFLDYYRIYDGNIEVVRIPWGSNIASKTLTPIGAPITVDSALSATSENPVQNKVVKTALDAKQDVLTAGQNVTIIGNVISADVDSTEIAANVTDWLDDNVNPAGSAVVVDSSLSIDGAAADALKTGKIKRDLSTVKNELFHVNAFDGEWKQGAYASSDGSYVNRNDYICTVNPIYIKDSEAAIVENYNSPITGQYYFLFWDENNNYLGYKQFGVLDEYGLSDVQFSNYHNAAYMHISVTNGYGINTNISDAPNIKVFVNHFGLTTKEVYANSLNSYGFSLLNWQNYIYYFNQSGIRNFINNRIGIIDPIKAQHDMIISIDSTDYKFAVLFFASEELGLANEIRATAWTDQPVNIARDDIFLINVKRSDETNITPEEGKHIKIDTPIESFNGFALGADSVKRGVKTQNIGVLTYAQSFCRYNGNYFSTNGSNIGVQSSDFTAISTTALNVGHGNAFQLGNNGKAYISGWDNQKIYVIDLATLTIESEIVLPTQGYTTAVIDDLNRIAYIFQRDSYPSTVVNYNFIIYDYQAQQIKSTRVINAFSAMQAADFYNGKIAVLWGMGTPASPSGMAIYNTGGDIIAEFTLDVFSNTEPEGVYFDRETGELYISLVDRKVYKIL